MNEVDWWELETQHNDTVTRDELKTHLAAALARAEAAESELSKYRQWHEQAQIRAVDAEFELAQFMDDMIACLGLPDREYGDSVGEVIVAAVTKIIARAEAAEKRVSELEAKLAALEGWEVPDGVEYPVGRVDVLVVREAVWRNWAEEWQDTRSDLYLHDVIAYRDKPRGDSGE